MMIPMSGYIVIFSTEKPSGGTAGSLFRTPSPDPLSSPSSSLDCKRTQYTSSSNAQRLGLDLSGLALALLVGHDNVVHVLGPGDLGTGGGEDDLDVTRVSLVRVDSTVGPVSPSSGFLNDSQGRHKRTSHCRQLGTSGESRHHSCPRGNGYSREPVAQQCS